ncbi:G patch domain-containing protein 4 [Pseudolycoriella hygida]|uniref:G patch domain-containing protein 4 n=1 Tax=Pseudolycoriella hygida TaxID=35572 RepID=A0A9Q0N0P4_9DIPT|nr:G patch domain-containing protein 4 [Pseudolycoriella hygida]
MDFAKSILEKYGWNEGEGIGKNSDGIVKPIKASLKFNTAGLGHNRADEFNNHWWEKAFNDAASNINVNDSTDKISVSLKSGESIEYSASGYSAKQFSKQKAEGKSYDGNFKKSKKVLHGLNASDSDSSDDACKMKASSPAIFTNVLSDKELVAACGGRTAHKGARHGLTLMGKLSRIQAQDEQLLAQMQKIESNTNTDESWTTVKKRKKRKNKDPSIDVDMPVEVKPTEINTSATSDAAASSCIDHGVKHLSKKSRKKQRARVEKLADILSKSTLDDNAIGQQVQMDNDKSRKKKKKAKKMKTADKETLEQGMEQNEVVHETRKRKKTSRKEQMREAIQIAAQRNGENEKDSGLDDNKFKKKRKLRKLDTEVDFSSGGEAIKRVRKCEAVEDSPQKPITPQQVLKEHRRLTKITNRMERIWPF